MLVTRVPDESISKLRSQIKSYAYAHEGTARPEISSHVGIIKNSIKFTFKLQFKLRDIHRIICNYNVEKRWRYLNVKCRKKFNFDEKFYGNSGKRRQRENVLLFCCIS